MIREKLGLIKEFFNQLGHIYENPSGYELELNYKLINYKHFPS